MPGRHLIWGKKALCVFVCTLTVMLCILPMGLSPVWNGEIPGHRNQYEIMAESILAGHLYLDREDIDPKLLAMENPYDPWAREEQGVDFCFDHAFYKGHYYMYFGVVPVFLLFLPFRAITGTSLVTYHATQVFVAVFIVGIFALFHFIKKRFFHEMPWGVYLALACAVSVMSVWYSADAPSLYCTAITAGLCVEVWSVFFFVKAVHGEGVGRTQRDLYFLWGGLLGALAFGCRPPVALANLLAVPLLAGYWKRQENPPKMARELALAALPYVIVAILLMLYNYLRFEDPFEFGQTYQLTVGDQSAFQEVGFSQQKLVKILNGVAENLISYKPLSQEFPYISHNGAYINFPILLFGLFGFTQINIRRRLKEKNIWGFSVVLFWLPVLVTVVDVLWSPWLIERYRMDIYWLMGMLCFIMAGFYHMTLDAPGKMRFRWGIVAWSSVTIVTCVLLYLVPYDYNFTDYYPEYLERIRELTSSKL